MQKVELKQNPEAFLTYPFIPTVKHAEDQCSRFPISVKIPPNNKPDGLWPVDSVVLGNSRRTSWKILTNSYLGALVERTSTLSSVAAVLSRHDRVGGSSPLREGGL